MISENGPNSERSHLIRNRPVSTVTPLSSSLTRNGFSYVPRLTADPYSNVYSASDDTGTSAWKSTSTHFTVPSRHRPSVRVCNATSLPDWSSKRIVRDEPRTPCGKGTPSRAGAVCRPASTGFLTVKESRSDTALPAAGVGRNVPKVLTGDST